MQLVINWWADFRLESTELNTWDEKMNIMDIFRRECLTSASSIYIPIVSLQEFPNSTLHSFLPVSLVHFQKLEPILCIVSKRYLDCFLL
jgi:hypothetical protein